MKLLNRPSRRIANSPQYKWWAYFAIATGMWLTVMDQSGVNIALPRIAEHFDADIPTVQWITLGYVLSTSAMLMPMGRLSDMIGRKRVYMSGMVVFMGAAALGGGAQVFALLDRGQGHPGDWRRSGPGQRDGRHHGGIPRTRGGARPWARI